MFDDSIENKFGLKKVYPNPMSDNEYLIWEKQIFNRLVDYLNEPCEDFGEDILALSQMKITWHELRRLLTEHEPQQPEPFLRQGRLF